MSYHGYDPGDRINWYQSPSIGPMRQGPPELSVAAAQYRVSPGFAPTRTAVLDGSSAQPTGTYTGFSLYSHSYTPQIPPPQYYPPSPPSQSFTQNPQFHIQISSMVDSTHSVSPIHSHMTHSVYSLPQTPNHLFYTTSQPLQHPRNFHSPCQHPPTPSEIYQHYPPTQPHFIPTNQFAPPPPAYEQQRPISLAPDRVHENQMDPRILEMQDSFEAIRARQSSFRAQILEELGQLHLGPKAPVIESASSPLKFGSLPAGSVTLTVANGSSSTLSASSRGIPISEKPNLKLSPHEVTLGLNKNFTTAFVNGNHSEHTTTAVMTEELVLNVDKNIARGFTGVKFSDSYGGDVATSIVWRNDAQTHCFQHTSFRDGSAAGYGELVSHNHNSVGNIRVDFHEREEKELEDAYGEDDNEDEGENDSTESYVDGESYSDDFQSVDGQIVTDSDEEVVTDDEGSRPCIKKEALLEIMYQSKDPKSLDEAEMLENLFNCLCGLLMPLENKDINAGIKEETSKRDVGDSSLGVASLEPLKLIEFAKQVAEQLFGRADILELVGVCAIFISAFVLVGTHDQLFSYYKSRLIKHLKELGHVFDIKGQMEMANKHYENLLKEKDQHRDIASIAMTQSFTQSILVSILLQLIKGSTVLGVNTEMKCECLDILCNVLRKFGNIMATDHELCSESSTIVVDRSCCCSLVIVCAHELQTAKGTRESHCLELEVNAKEAKLKLQRKLNELESLLTGSEKNENEFEASLESVSGKWKHKQGSFQSFVDYQAGALTELNAALPSTRREILSAKQSHSEEFNCMGSKLGGLADAPEKYHVVLVEKVFARRPEVSVVSWNVMITGYSLIFQNQKAIEYLPRIQTQGVGPDEVTHINLPAACVKSGDIKSGRQMSDNISRPNAMSVNAIISVYFQKEDHMEVIKLLREMLFRGLHLDQSTLAIALSSSALMGIFAWRTFPLSTFMILGALLISVLHAMVRLYVHKILVVIQTLWIDEGYYARVEGREMISNLSKASASKFLLNWLVQLEHEYHKWSAAISLGLISSGLLITDHKHVLEKCLGVDYFLQAATLQELVQEFVGDGIPLVLPPNIQDNEEYGGLIVNDEDVRAGVVLHDDRMMIVEDYITDGDKEPTIPLLWNMFVHLQLPLLAKKTTLADETCKIQETMDGSINADSPPIFSGFHDQALIMILYSLRLIRAWHKSMGYLPFEDSNYPTMPWFSYSFLGLGVTLCSGHIVADTANGYGFQMISCKGAQILIQNMKLEDKFV